MKLQVRQRDRRALMGLVIAGGLYALLSIVVFPTLDRLKGASVNVTAKEEQLRKYRQVRQRKGHYVELLQKAQANVTEAESRLIRGDNPSVASIELQGLVDAAAQKFDIVFAQRNISTVKKRDEFFNETTMTVAFQCSPNVLTSFLSELRNAPKFLTIRNAQVSPIEGMEAPPKKGELKKFVRVSLTIAAILSSPVTAPAPTQEKK